MFLPITRERKKARDKKEKDHIGVNIGLVVFPAIPLAIWRRNSSAFFNATSADEKSNRSDAWTMRRETSLL